MNQRGFNSCQFVPALKINCDFLKPFTQQNTVYRLFFERAEDLMVRLEEEKLPINLAAFEGEENPQESKTDRCLTLLTPHNDVDPQSNRKCSPIIITLYLAHHRKESAGER